MMQIPYVVSFLSLPNASSLIVQLGFRLPQRDDDRFARGEYNNMKAAPKCIVSGTETEFIEKGSRSEDW